MDYLDKKYMPNNNTLVSIIMPCYNSANYLSQAIESVLSQIYQDWELLIIDNCSTDNSLLIVREYIQKDKRIKLFTTKRNSKTPVEPRNIGIRNARGRYIAFLDSDDLWISTKLESQVKLFNHDKVLIVFSWYEKIKENGMRNNRIITSPNLIDYGQLLKGNCIGCLTAIYDTSKLGKCYFQSVKYEDYALWLTMLMHGYLACNTNTVEALYRVRKNSVSSNKLRVLIWTWNIYRNVLKLNITQSIYYYCFYLFKAIFKYIK